MTQLSVFIADGEKHVREALRLLLEYQADFVVAGEANHTESLLAQVCKQPPDAILLDWNLPGIHPQRLIRTLREHCPTTQIVGMGVKPEQERDTLKVGVVTFLSKHLSPDQFLTKLGESLKRHPRI